MRVAIYVRVSSQHQAQTQTIEQQLERLRQHCQLQGWPCEEPQIFRDDGFSGSKLKRPGLDRLRDKVAQAAFELILITAPDRLARKYVHQMLLIEEFEKAGCQVEFVERPMSQEPNDQLLLQIRGAVAEYERSLIAERMRRGRLQKYKAGAMLPWSHPPYGYALNPDRPRDPQGVALVETEAAVIAEIYRLFLEQNYGLGKIAQHFLNLGIKSPKGYKRWAVSSLRRILTNPVYTGVVYAGRERSRPIKRRLSALKPIGAGRGYEKVAPSEWIEVCRVATIVSQEQFEMARQKLSDNLRMARRNNKTHSYLLRALVSCGKCKSFCVSVKRGGQGYYICRAKYSPILSNRDEKCGSRYIPSAQLDELVWKDLGEILRCPEIIEEALKRTQAGEWLPQSLQAQRENLGKAQTSLGRQLERWTEAYLTGVLELEEYKRRRVELEQRQQSLHRQQEQLAASINQQVELMGIATSITDFCGRVSQGLNEATFEQKRQLIELLVDRVIVQEEEVEIRYVVPTTPSSENTRFYHLLSDYFDNIYYAI